MINWEDPKSRISKFFIVGEAIFLPKWTRLANVGDGLTIDAKHNIESFLVEKMDVVREMLDKKIHVHICYRPQAYNALVGGAERSAHMALDNCAAIDFHVDGMTCDEVRAFLLPELDGLDLRMENKPGSSWVHLDNKPTFGRERFFKV